MYSFSYNSLINFFQYSSVDMDPETVMGGNVREGITFQTWHTPLNIRTEIKVGPLPTTAHPQQSLQSAPIVWPWPITDNGSPPKMRPRRLKRSCTQHYSPPINTRDAFNFTQSDGLKQIEDDMKFFFLLHFDLRFAPYCHKPFQSVLCCCVFLITHDTGACSTKTRNNCQVLESPFQFFDIFCWSSNARDLASSWTYPFFFVRKGSTHLWLL